ATRGFSGNPVGLLLRLLDDLRLFDFRVVAGGVDRLDQVRRVVVALHGELVALGGAVVGLDAFDALDRLLERLVAAVAAVVDALEGAARDLDRLGLRGQHGAAVVGQLEGLAVERAPEAGRGELVERLLRGRIVGRRERDGLPAGRAVLAAAAVDRARRGAVTAAAAQVHVLHFDRDHGLA